MICLTHRKRALNKRRYADYPTYTHTKHTHTHTTHAIICNTKVNKSTKIKKFKNEN